MAPAHKETAQLLADALGLSDPARALFVAAAPAALLLRTFWRPFGS
jgi:hypothetical protein